MAGAGISYKIEYLRINRTCPASTCGIFHTLYEPKFQVALTHRNWTGGLLPVNASSYILGASIQPLAWLCVGCSGLVRVYQACAVFPMDMLGLGIPVIDRLPYPCNYTPLFWAPFFINETITFLMICYKAWQSRRTEYTGAHFHASISDTVIRHNVIYYML